MNEYDCAEGGMGIVESGALIQEKWILGRATLILTVLG